MKRILITSIGSWSAASVIASLRKTGSYRLIGCDIYPAAWLSESIQVDAMYTIPKASSGAGYIDAITNVCKNEKVDFVICLNDAEIDVLSQNRELFKSMNCRLCFSSAEAIETSRNKLRWFELLKNEVGLCLIPTFTYDQYHQSGNLFPCIAKPARGRSSENIFVFYTLSQFHAASEYVRKHVVQPLYEGVVVTVDVVRHKQSGAIVQLQRKELVRTKNGAGITVEMITDPLLSRMVETISNTLDMEGCINMEFLLHKERYFLMDINPRFSAGIQFSVLSGYDVVTNHLRCFDNKAIDPQPEYPDRIFTTKFVQLSV